MLLDIYFHLIWCYFFVVLCVTHGLSGKTYFLCILYLALTLHMFEIKSHLYMDALVM